MKRCPQCNRFEAEDTLTFCRVDGTPLVRESGAAGEGAGTIKVSPAQGADTTETRILPTGEVPGRPTAPTTVLDGQKAPGSTGELRKPKSRRGVAVAIVAVAALALAASAYLYLPRGQNSAAKNSVAVLPFVNASNDPDVEYLSDGISESLINSLSQLPGVRVLARSTMFSFKGKELNPQEVGRRLGVETVLTGRVVQRGDSLTVQADLVDVADGSQLWGERYSRKVSDLLAVQNEIAREISDKLRLRLSGEAERRLTKSSPANPEAYQLYLQGLYHWNKRSGDDIRKSIALFRQATEKDPSYAQAHGGLAMAFNVLGANTVMTAEEQADTGLKAKAAALKALELDAALPEAYAVLAEGKVAEWDFDGAEKDYRRAVELNPNFATARQWFSTLLSRLKRHDEAIAEIKKAYELDPFSRAVNMNVGNAYFAARRYDEAIAQYRKLIEMEPTYPFAYGYLSAAYAEKGMYGEAIEQWCGTVVLLRVETEEGCERNKTALRQALKSGGETAFWRQALEHDLRNYERRIISAAYLAGSYARAGEKERAFELLEKAYAERESSLADLLVDASFDNLRSDPRFADLVRRVGLRQ